MPTSKFLHSGNLWQTAEKRRKSPSPNAGIPEAGFAGALGVRLGGTNFYQGEREDRPLIGEKLKEKDKKDILLAIKLVQVFSVLTFLAFLSGYWWFAKLLWR